MGIKYFISVFSAPNCMIYHLMHFQYAVVLNSKKYPDSKMRPAVFFFLFKLEKDMRRVSRTTWAPLFPPDHFRKDNINDSL
jgi:hypothetical protein